MAKRIARCPCPRCGRAARMVDQARGRPGLVHVQHHRGEPCRFEATAQVFAALVERIRGAWIASEERRARYVAGGPAPRAAWCPRCGEGARHVEAIGDGAEITVRVLHARRASGWRRGPCAACVTWREAGELRAAVRAVTGTAAEARTS